MTMKMTVKAGRQDQAAPDAVEDWDQRHLPELRKPRSSILIS
jgi:hypothetical protein